MASWETDHSIVQQATSLSVSHGVATVFKMHPSSQSSAAETAEDRLTDGENPKLLFALRVALVGNILYGTYQTHFTVDFGVKGLNLTTLLLLVAAWLTSSLRCKAATPAPLKGLFITFFVALFWSFLVGQLRDTSTMLDDLTVVKNMVFAMLLYFVTYHASGNRRTREILFFALLGVIALVTLHVWRQALDYGIGVYNETRRASGPFGPDARASNRAAAFFIIFLPVMLTAAIYLRHWRFSRWFAITFTVLGVAGSFFTYSRQAYFLVAMLFTYLAFRRNWMFAVAVLALVLSYEAWAPAGVVDRVQVTSQEDAHGNVKMDESTESRFIIWAGAAEMITNNPLGVGLNRFQREIGSYVPEYAGYDAHNNYVRFTAEGGIPGIAAMVALLLGLFVLSRRVVSADNSNETRLLGTAFMISVLGVVFSNLYGSRFFDADIMGAFWMLAGLAARHLTMVREEVVRSSVPNQSVLSGY